MNKKSTNKGKKAKKAKKAIPLKEKIVAEIKEHFWRDMVIALFTMWFAGILGQALKLPIATAALREKGFTGSVSEAVKMCFSLNPLKCMWASISTVSGILSLLLTIALVWFGYNYGIKPRIKQETGYKDDRNFTVAEEGTYGTSSLMRKEEVGNVLDMKEVGEQEDRKSVV